MSTPETSPVPRIDFDIETDRKRMLNSFLFSVALFFKLPLAFFAGLRVDSLSRQRCEVSLPYGWRSQNPFQSIYFAAQAMGAEMSTGAIAMLATRNAPVSVAVIVVGTEATFSKKANARTTFTCEMGEELFAAVERAIHTGESSTVDIHTVGRMPDGTEVSRFRFTWSFKTRTKG